MSNKIEFRDKSTHNRVQQTISIYFEKPTNNSNEKLVHFTKQI